jgi:REP element-mobilizing transposase RayT
MEDQLPQVREFHGYDWFSTKNYRRNLPHWELKGSTYFMTTRVDSKVGKPFQDPLIASLMVSYLCRDHTQKYLLQAYVVMPDHLHLIRKPFHEYTLAQIMQNLKGTAAFAINKLLKRKGKFWQCENFDHLIRDNIGLRKKWEYIKQNPVRARLVNKAEDYPFSSFYTDSRQSAD